MYLGQLIPIEDYRSFGCYTNTHNKIIVLCDSFTINSYSSVETMAGNMTMKEAINAIHAAFVAAIQNPFHPVGYPIVSKSFDSQIIQIVNKFNSTVATVIKTRKS